MAKKSEKEQAEHEFEKLHDQIKSLHEELSTLSKKSSNDALNRFKLKVVNDILSRSNGFLGEKYKPFNDFEIFDEASIPTNSDVTMMLGQYLACMEKLRYDQSKSTGSSTFSGFDGF